MTPFYNKNTASAITQTAQVLLPIIRRVMATQLANDIIGVQPMTGPAGGIFSLKPTYYPITVKLTKDHYRYFLRVYNRRQYHTVDYIDSLGYPVVKLTRRDDGVFDAMNARVWAIQNLKSGSYISSGAKFWFAREKDHTLFLLRWT
jgi:hypothetical protein